jgi:hypothetical protein
VQNNSNKINEKKEYINIPIPVFKVLDEDYYFQEEPERKENNNKYIDNNKDEYQKFKDLELNSDTINNVKIIFLNFLIS